MTHAQGPTFSRVFQPADGAAAQGVYHVIALTTRARATWTVRVRRARGGERGENGRSKAPGERIYSSLKEPGAIYYGGARSGQHAFMVRCFEFEQNRVVGSPGDRPRRYVITGPPGSPYENGIYQGQIDFPADYPFKPPAISMLTPNGACLQWSLRRFSLASS